MKISEQINAARLRAGAYMRERREKAAERRAQQRMTGGHDGRFWLLSIPAAATLCAAFVEIYWAVLFCIEATGHVDWNYEGAVGTAAPAAATWNMAFSAHLPVLIGLVTATVPIVMWSMVWLPVQMKARGHGRWRRVTMICAGLLANLLVIVSGTVVMNYNRQDQVREAVVIEQTAAQGRAAIGARLEFAREELRIATTNANPYLNQAANVGAAEWERSYVTQARATNDPRLPMLERAVGAARRADQLRADIERLTIERAQAAPEAASAANVEDRVGVGLNTFAQYAEVYRPPFVALICTIIGIFGAWWWVGLSEAMDRHSVSLSGWADKAHRVEDLRGQEIVDASGVVKRPQYDERGRVVFDEHPVREDIVDAITGERLTRVKPHLRKVKPKKGVPTEVAIPAQTMADEVGVSVDWGARAATLEVDSTDKSEHDADNVPHGGVAHDLTPEETLEAYIALNPTLAEPVEAPLEINEEDVDGDGDDKESDEKHPDDKPDEIADTHLPLPDGEGVMQRDEPEAREDRLIAAE